MTMWRVGMKEGKVKQKDFGGRGWGGGGVGGLACSRERRNRKIWKVEGYLTTTLAVGK